LVNANDYTREIRKMPSFRGYLAVARPVLESRSDLPIFSFVAFEEQVERLNVSN
jgi:hypothetical protein